MAEGTWPDGPATTTETYVLVQLNAYDRLAILAGCAAILLIALIVVVCKLTPWCWLHRHCPIRAKYDDQEVTERSWREDVKLMPVLSYGSTQEGHKLQSPNPDRLKAIRESSGPDTSSEDFIELPRKRSEYTVDGAEHHSPYSSSSSRPVSPDPSYVSDRFRGGCIDFSLKYEREDKQLQIKIVGVKDLSEEHGIADQYVKVKVFRKSRSRSLREKISRDEPKSNLQLEKQTRIQKDSTEPIFNETFTVDIPEEDLKLYVLKLQLFDFDKYSRHLASGETTFSLNSINMSEIGEVTLNQELQVPRKENLGEIYLCLSYLPTAEKLTIIVTKAKDLRKMDKEQSSTDSVVKVALMHEGRQLKKVKTHVHRNELNPTYHEAFIFDVPNQQLDKVYFMVAVMHISSEKLQPVKNLLIGRVYLGHHFEGTELAHWREMIQHPRKQIACWHKLK